MARVQVMPIGFRCTGCRSRLHVPKRWSGNTLSCPNCGTRVVVPAAARESGDVASPAVFEDVAVERSLKTLEAPVAAKRGGSFGDDAFDLPPPKDPGAGEKTGGTSRNDITLSRWTIYAFIVMVPVVAAAAFLLGYWWAAADRP